MVLEGRRSRFIQQEGCYGCAEYQDVSLGLSPIMGTHDSSTNSFSVIVRSLCGRRNIRLELQQPGMERRRANSTRYVGFQRRLQWRIDWRFPAAADALLSDNRCASSLCTR